MPFPCLEAIQEALQIIWAQFAVGIPIQCRRQDGALVLIHLLLVPSIKDGDKYLPLGVP